MTRIQGLLGTQRPVAPRSQAAAILGVLREFDRTQWWPPEKLQQLQFRQLSALLAHAHRNVPFYRQRLNEVGIDPRQPLTLDCWQKIPVLTRTDLQDNLTVSHRLPRTHGKILKSASSGSTGQPLLVRSTEYLHFLWQVLTIREHCWHRRDPATKFAAIRIFEPKEFPPEGLEMKSWGGVMDLLFKTGPAVLFSIRSDIGKQAAWLQKQNPAYLLTFPFNLGALTGHCRKKNIRLPNLRQIRTMGETLTPELRRSCSDYWGIPLIDHYSTGEMGYITLQCPEHEHQHVQSEVVMVEVLDDEGRSCRPGEIGRIILTSLYNLAAPLIRYEIMDYAQVGGLCTCGRGLPVIKRIMGRRRNMMVLPGGEKRWPVIGGSRYREIAPIRQFQFIQRTTARIEARLVCERPLTRTEEEQLGTLILESLGYPFHLTFAYLEEIPPKPGGKFEEFISEVPG